MTAIRPSKKSIEPITIIIVAANTIHPAMGRACESLYAAVVAAISTSLGSLGDADMCRRAHSLLLTGRREGAERIRTAVRGFAGLCLTTRPRRREGPWYPGVSLGNPALERRRELQFVRPCPRALLVQVLDRAHDVLHRGGLLRRCVLQPALRLLALDDRVHDEQCDVHAVLT